MLPTAKCRHITSDGMSFLGGDGEQAVRRYQHPSATSDQRFSAPSGKNAVSQLGCFLLSEPGCGGATAAVKTLAGGPRTPRLPRAVGAGHAAPAGAPRAAACETRAGGKTLMSAYLSSELVVSRKTKTAGCSQAWATLEIVSFRWDDQIISEGDSNRWCSCESLDSQHGSSHAGAHWSGIGNRPA